MEKRFKLYKLFCLLSILFILLISIWYALIPQIIIKDKNTEIELNSKYSDSKIIVKNIFGNKKYKVETKNNINNKKVGKYKITYTVKKGFITVKRNKIVEVIDSKAPEITLEAGDEISVCPNKEYEELGYKAIDNYDGDITKKVQIIKNKNYIKYKVKDKSGNVTVKDRKLKYEDKIPPELKLNGEVEMSIQKYSSYNEPGYSAIDNCDGDITEKVVVEGSVDTNNDGTYEITYRVTDSNENTTELKRKVTVFTKTSNYSNPDNTSGVIYLTFDDGPSSSVTSSILDILKEEGVKATFFVINHGDGLNYLIKREYDEGHTVALHSYTHRYESVYSSVDAYFNDLYAISDKVKSITGEESKIIRFPGGSSNTISRNYSRGIMSTLVNEVANRGFVYFDWNVSSGDAGGAHSSSDVYNNVVNGLSRNRSNVVLCHDFENNYKTLNALRDIIRYGKENGYSFDRITTSTYQAKQRVNN